MADAHRPPAPQRSREQRLQALAHTNAVRHARAELKQQLKDGTLDIADLLARPPEAVRTARVSDLLLAVPKLGPARVARLLNGCRISPRRTIAGLSERQRVELVARTRPPSNDRPAAGR